MDRALQALHLLALDPVAETPADKNSYGFRQQRSCADAIQRNYFPSARQHGAGRTGASPEGEISKKAAQASSEVIPVSTTGSRSGNSATRDSFPPIASTERRSVEMCISVRFSISEICFCATPRFFAMRTCVISRARRSCCKVISSASSTLARFSILRRRLTGKFLMMPLTLRAIIYFRSVENIPLRVYTYKSIFASLWTIVPPQLSTAVDRISGNRDHGQGEPKIGHRPQAAAAKVPFGPPFIGRLQKRIAHHNGQVPTCGGAGGGGPA